MIVYSHKAHGSDSKIESVPTSQAQQSRQNRY
jgi:hypothetical protein